MAKIPCPETGVYVVFIDKPHLHGVFCIEHRDHRVKVLVHIFEQTSLFFCQLKRFRPCDHLFGFFFLRIGHRGFEKVAAAPASSDHDDRGFRKVLKTLLHFSGKGIAAASVSEVPQFIVDMDLLLFQCVFHGLRARDLRRGGVNRFYGRSAEDADLRTSAERQHIAVVFQKNDPLSEDLCRDLGSVFPQLLGIGILFLIILRALFSLDLISLLAKCQTNGLFPVRRRPSCCHGPRDQRDGQYC